MSTAEVTTQDGRQIVQLPASCQIADGKVLIKRVGSSLLLVPDNADSWPMLLASLDEFTEDYLDERIQPEIDERDPSLG